jgi:hypothetical protein
MDSRRKRVVLVGDSLVLAGAQAGLEAVPSLEVIALQMPPAGAAAELRSLAPDVIIFDSNASPPDAALSLLRARPRLLLIGVDPATDQMLLWSGEQSRALGMQDLVRAITASEREGGRPAPRPALAPRLQRLAGLGPARALTRKQKLGFALGALALAACLGVVLWPAVGQGTAPLSGAAIGNIPAEVGLPFAAGLLLGGFALGLWLRLRQRK